MKATKDIPGQILMFGDDDEREMSIAETIAWAKRVSANEWLTANEAASYLRINYFTLVKLVQCGKIFHPPHGPHTRYRFRREWLDRYVMAGAGGEYQHLGGGK